MANDIFEQLDQELESMKSVIIEDMDKLNNQKASIVKELIEFFWQVWIRFDRIKVHFTIEPSPSTFALFKEYPDNWSFRPEFDFSAVNEISITDKTQDQGRIGDRIIVNFYNIEKSVHMRILFEYCDGEHYYKYSGWKRIFSQQIIYDCPLDKAKTQKVYEVLSVILKIWFESHLRRNRELIIKHMKDNFEKGETFTTGEAKY